MTRSTVILPLIIDSTWKTRQRKKKDRYERLHSEEEERDRRADEARRAHPNTCLFLPLVRVQQGGRGSQSSFSLTPENPFFRVAPLALEEIRFSRIKKRTFPFSSNKEPLILLLYLIFILSTKVTYTVSLFWIPCFYALSLSLECKKGEILRKKCHATTMNYEERKIQGGAKLNTCAA